MDDPYLITRNTEIRSQRPLYDYFNQSYLEGALKGDFGYRPLQKIRVAMLYGEAISRFQPLSQSFARIFHLSNIRWYLACLTILFFLSRNFFERDKNLGAFLVTLLFAVFPAHTEAVCNIKQGEEILAATFLFLAWFLFRMSGPIRFLAPPAFLAALFSKEITAVFPLLLIWEDLTLLKGEKRWSTRWKDYAGLGVVGVIWLFLRMRATRVAITGKLLGSDGGANIVFFTQEDGIWVRLLTTSKVFLRHYFYDALGPNLLNPSFSSRYAIGLEYNPSLEGVLSALVIAAFIGCLFVCLARGWKKTAFWIGFFFIMNLVTSNIFLRLGSGGAYRFLFIPLLAYCVLIAGVFLSLWRKRPVWIRFTAALLLLLLVSFYVKRTRDLIPIWDSNKTLYNYSYSVDQNNPRILLFRFHNVARDQIGERMGYMEEAIQLWESEPRSIRGQETAYYWEALDNLAYLLMFSGKDPDRALELARKALEVSRRSEVRYLIGKVGMAVTPTILGMILYRQGNKEEGLELLRTAIKTAPQIPSPRLFLISSFYREGKKDLYLQELEAYVMRPEITLALEPIALFLGLHYELAYELYQDGDHEKATMVLDHLRQTGYLKDVPPLSPPLKPADWGGPLVPKLETDYLNNPFWLRDLIH